MKRPVAVSTRYRTRPMTPEKRIVVTFAESSMETMACTMKSTMTSNQPNLASEPSTREARAEHQAAAVKRAWATKH
jgi:hypothetical protein